MRKNMTVIHQPTNTLSEWVQINAGLYASFLATEDC